MVKNILPGFTVRKLRRYWSTSEFPEIVSFHFQLCTEHPLLFFFHDRAGGWVRLDSKLKVNKLYMTGEKVPANPSEVLGALADQAEFCVAEGATDLVVPDEAVSYKSLIKTLEEKGLIKPSSSKKPSDRNVDIDPALRDQHRSEV